MKLIYNKIVPTKGFAAINLFGVIFVRKGITLDQFCLNHERIHSRQMLEMLIIPFYVWYLVEWLIRLVCYRNAKKAYFNLLFEREAYLHQKNLAYLKERRFWAWIRERKE